MVLPVVPFIAAGLVLYGKIARLHCLPFVAWPAIRGTRAQEHAHAKNIFKFDIDSACTGPFVALARCVAAIASGSKNLDLMASVKVWGQRHS